MCCRTKQSIYDCKNIYIECDCSVNTVAEKSGVHRNTVNNRIKQIRDLLGSTLTEKKKLSLYWHLKLKI
ncbi:helix-turn-helix domain-containing protein [Yeguia hominis]|uniref:helix-turn-helix domain-containing protein n=1 Tax=Yeguia hominis TaxID=2763662 RepID=UPI003D2737E9